MIHITVSCPYCNRNVRVMVDTDNEEHAELVHCQEDERSCGKQFVYKATRYYESETFKLVQG